MSEASTPLEQAQKSEILELERQIRLLNTKISAAVDHAADLQDEIRTMKQREKADQEARELAASETGLRRMSTYFTGRRPSATPSMLTGISPSQSISGPSGDQQQQQQQQRLSIGRGSLSGPSRLSNAEELHAQLAREQALRREAEQKFTKLQEESETLSASVFEEANKMVSTERRQAHAIEERLKVHQEREEERRTRLLNLEKAMERITRVRSVLAQEPKMVAAV